MKRIVIIAGIVFSGLFTSCQDIADEMLTTETKSTVDPSILFSQPDLAKGAVDGIKIPFAETNSYRGRFLTYYGLNSDTEWFNASQTVDDKSTLCTYAAQANNGQMNSADNVWAQMYSGIERANLCIAGLRQYGNPVPGSQMGQLLGTSLTLRAIYYADLLKSWGDVPARFEPLTSATTYVPKSNRDVIYKQLIADLGEAETLVAWPNESAYTATVEQINKAFVKAFRARLAMVASGYSQYPDGVRKSTDPDLSVANMYKLALDECNDVINSGTVHLESSFESLWRKYNQEDLSAGSEPLWEIPFADGRGRMLFTFAVKHVAAKDQFQNNGANRGGTAGPLPTIWYDYDQADSRRSVTCVPYRWSATTSGSTIAHQEFPSTTGSDTWCFGKYRYEWMNRYVTSQNDDGVNKIYMRYAEVLLMAAEAANELNGPAEAAPYLRQIRMRAFPNPADQAQKVDAYITEKSSSKQTMFDALVDENKFEFTGEMDRKMALIRWNLLSAKINEAKSNMNDLIARQGRYADVPSTLYWKFAADGVSLDIYGLNRGEKTPDASYTNSIPWTNLKSDKVNAIYINNPDSFQFWPIWQVFLDASNGQLKNDYGY
jgi:hypothetical protein